MWWLHGIQRLPPETAVVPPITGAFSSTSTLAPSSAAASAPVSAAAPEPTTTRSASAAVTARVHRERLEPAQDDVPLELEVDGIGRELDVREAAGECVEHDPPLEP